MSIVTTAFSAATYFAMWQATEQEIIDTGLKIAGLESVENSADVLNLNNRLGALQSLSASYKLKYENAFYSEQGGSKYGRLPTYTNGL